MKLAVNKKQFLGSWSLAERSTSAGGTVSILSSILIKASAESVILQATDIKTSVICRAAGVTVLEPGEAVFPIKMVSDLFKKAPGEEFTLDVDGGKVVLKAGRSKYNFSTYPVSEFPALPSSDEADVFCSIPAGELAKVLDEGTLAASAGEEFPLYLSSANLQIISSRLNIVSTDTRRLALSAAPVLDGKEGESALLPMKGIKELQRILGSLTPETEVKVLFDGAQFYFKTETLEFTVRRVESKFPPYEKILPKHSTLDVLTDRGESSASTSLCATSTGWSSSTWLRRARSCCAARRPTSDRRRKRSRPRRRATSCASRSTRNSSSRRSRCCATRRSSFRSTVSRATCRCGAATATTSSAS